MRRESLAKMKKLQEEARQRILRRGKLEFRVEPELMSAVLDLAKERKLPVGPMIRQWVRERLEQEISRSPGPRSQLDIIEQKIDKLLSDQSRAESA